MLKELEGILEGLKKNKDLSVILMYKIDPSLVKGIEAIEEYNIDNIKDLNGKIFSCTERLLDNDLDKITDDEVALSFKYEGKLIIATDDMDLIKSLVRVFKNIVETVLIDFVDIAEDYMITKVTNLKEERIDALGEPKNLDKVRYKSICVASRQLNDIFSTEDAIWMSSLDKGEIMEHSVDTVIKYAKNRGTDYIVQKVSDKLGDKLGKTVRSFFDSF